MAQEGGRVVLGQGELYFGGAPGTITTLLGSCVAVTLWHPRLHIGGMCHVVVPQKLKQTCDFRYPCCVVEQFNKDVAQYGTRPGEYKVGIYGGGNMFPDIQTDRKLLVGLRNIESMQDLMEASGFKVSEFHVGGNSYRRVSLRLENGEVIVSGRDVQDTSGHVKGMTI